MKRSASMKDIISIDQRLLGWAYASGSVVECVCYGDFFWFVFFFQAEDGIRDDLVTGVQTCALPICPMHGAEIEGTRADVRGFGIRRERTRPLGMLPHGVQHDVPDDVYPATDTLDGELRSEERRVGKECRSRGGPDQ